jgi:hypothetical protein
MKEHNFYTLYHNVYTKYNNLQLLHNRLVGKSSEESFKEHA